MESEGGGVGVELWLTIARRLDKKTNKSCKDKGVSSEREQETGQQGRNTYFRCKRRD